MNGDEGKKELNNNNNNKNNYNKWRLIQCDSKKYDRCDLQTSK